MQSGPSSFLIPLKFSNRIPAILLLLVFCSTFVKAEHLPMCTSFVDSSYIETTIENCNNSATFCLAEPIGDLLGYTITDNGSPYNGGLAPCDFDTAYAYTYSGIFGGGTSGPYIVTNWTVNGMNYSGEIADMAALTDSMNVWDVEGAWIHDASTTSIRGGKPSSDYSPINLTHLPSAMAETIAVSTTLNPKGTSITVDTGYHEIIFLDNSDGCLDTLELQVNCIPCSELYTGPKIFDVDNCMDEQAICFDIPESEFLDYTITDNGFEYTGQKKPCSTDSLVSYDYSVLPGAGIVGPYLLQSWSINGSVFLGGFDNVNALVDSMNVWDATGNWQINNTSQTITGGNPDSEYGAIQVLQILTGMQGTTPVEMIASVISMQIQLDTGLHNIVFLDNTNQCESSYDFEINCVSCPDYFNDTPIVMTAEHCDSLSDVCLPIPIGDLDNYSLTLNGAPYSGIVATCNMTTTQIQLDTGTYQLMLTHGISGCQDSATIIIDCVPIICTDFINEEFSAIQIQDCNANGTLCIEIPFNEISDYTISDNFLPFTGGTAACSDGTGLGLNPGWHEIILEHKGTACKDTINAMVACIIPETINTTIIVMQMDTICLDTSELMGNIISVNNFCEENSGEQVLFDLNMDTYCLTFEGIEEGMNQACIEICDDLGFCDTIYINVTVEPMIIEPNEDPPIAADEFAFTVEEMEITINILGNDTINGVLTDIGIVDEPVHGLVLIVDDKARYIPDEGYCSSTERDTFSYFICNEVACDTAWVDVEVGCQSFEIFSGFSPNGDGQNDYFTIRGVQAYPNNTLQIFNRWGLQVFSVFGYQNEWDGTWNGTELPDGTYFYYFENGEGSIASGYLQIQR